MKVDRCNDCGDSVAWGSGKFVNRLPADDGWICAECMDGVYDCDRCMKPIGFDEDIWLANKELRLCQDCATDDEKEEVENE